MFFFKKFTCNRCKKKFSRIENLMHHQQIYHESKYYRCEKCNEEYEGMEQMRHHIKRDHNFR